MQTGHDQYTVGWICALPFERAAAVGMLDERHDSLPQDHRDHNSYTLGRIGSHNVIIASLPAGVKGVTSAARVASQMTSTFSSLRFGLMVGVGGGAPSEGHDIRLGDVVVSQPTGNSGGVVQYDVGKAIQEGQFERTGSLNKPPDVLLNAVGKLQASHILDEPALFSHVTDFGSKYPGNDFKYPGTEHDKLFEADYDHPFGTASCEKCDIRRLVERPPRKNTKPVVHYGTVASGNQVIKDGRTREQLRQKLNVLCFEMEAAGLLDDFPCLVVRGICDYADNHKNDKWQPYAAVTAAAYAKELLNVISGPQVMGTRKVGEDIKGKGKAGQPTTPNSETDTSETFSTNSENGAPNQAEPDQHTEDSYFGHQRDLLDKSLPIFAIIGVSGVGKSSFIHTLGGRHVSTRDSPIIGHGLESCTRSVEFFEFTLSHGGRGYLIDTPGINDDDVKRNDAQIMNMIHNELEALCNSDKLLMGMLFLFDISQPRIGGSIINGLNMSIDMIEHLLGKNGVAKITIVTTRWAKNPDYEIKMQQNKREEQLRQKYWKWPLSYNSKVERYDGTRKAALHILSDLEHRRRPILSGAVPNGSFDRADIHEEPTEDKGPSHENTASPGSFVTVAWKTVSTLILRGYYIICVQYVLSWSVVSWHLCHYNLEMGELDVSIPYYILTATFLLATFLLCPGWPFGKPKSLAGNRAQREDWLSELILSQGAAWIFRLAVGWISVHFHPSLSIGLELPADTKAVSVPSTGMEAVAVPSADMEPAGIHPTQVALIHFLQNVFIPILEGRIRSDLIIFNILQLFITWNLNWRRGWWYRFAPTRNLTHFCTLLLPFLLFLYLRAVFSEELQLQHCHIMKVCCYTVGAFTWWSLYRYTPTLEA